MKKLTYNLSYLLLMIFLGLMLSILFNLINKDIKYVPLTELYLQKNELDQELARQEILIDRRKQLTQELETYSNIDDESLKSNLENELDYYETVAGLTDVKGEGVVVIIDDSQRDIGNDEPSSLIVHDFDILNIVKDLRNAGAEAISINGERVLFGKSQIICAGPTVEINNRTFAQPFIIKAIGDRFYLESAINSPNSYGSLLREWDIFLEVNTSINVEISKYKGNLSFGYINQEGE
jgi:uncharacterized protein YlxW (UPF0749 family)